MFHCVLNKKEEAFSLIELILAVGLVGIIATVSFLSLTGVREGQALKLATEEIRAALNDARNRSITQEGGENWGIRFINSTDSAHSYEIFKGSNYDEGEVFLKKTLRGKIRFSSPAEEEIIDVIFERGTGYLPNNKIIILAIKDRPGVIGNVVINKLGRISFWTEEGLVGYWPFDEGSGGTAHDASGNDNHGTLVGDPAWDEGKVGGALSFDGADSELAIPHSSDLNIRDEITISLWVKPEEVSGEISSETKSPADFFANLLRGVISKVAGFDY